jgi:hypothetical protein
MLLKGAKTKIREKHSGPTISKKDIFGLEVSMEHIIAMTVLHRSEELEYETFCVLGMMLIESEIFIYGSEEVSLWAILLFRGSKETLYY